jgi:GntR family transcriptional repressor for pyruvate dehydrogenase complex
MDTVMREQSPPKKRGTLVAHVSDDLRQSIISGKFGRGARLPSEAQLKEAHGVSRTVVREAIAVLRADGLVEARQGAGVFVLETPQRKMAPYAIDRDRISSMIELLELRTPVEIEAAGLAALRRSPAQEEEIFDRHAAIFKLIQEGKPIREADFALHLAIAEATNNPRFVEFLKMHGVTVIPRSEIITESSAISGPTYLEQLNREHEKIVLSISNGDEEGARNAMREHLKGSQVRHRELLRDERLRHGNSAALVQASE